MDEDQAPNVTPITGMGGGVPNMPQPQQPQVQQAPAPAPAAQPPSIDHDTLFGRAAKSLMGGSTSYSVDGNGNTVASSTPNSFQTFARNVLSASLLGAAAGASHPEQGFAGGFARGGAAGVQSGQQQDQQKQQQAQQQFKNQQEAQQNQREATAATTTDQLRKAQIAQSNAETYRTNMITQGDNFKVHNEVALNGKQHFSDYDAAGLKPVFKDVSESDMQQTLANRPGASTFDWEPTGVKVGVGSDGQPTHEYTYSAYDPKGQVPVSQATIDQWKKDGMDKYYPELFNIVKAGKPLDATQYIELKRTDSKLYNDNLVRQKDDQNTQEFTAKLNNTNAETAAHLATAAHERTATGMLIQEKTKQEAQSHAFEELNKVGGDFDKLTPKSKIIIGDAQAALIPGLNAEYKSILADDPTDSTGKAKEILGQIDGIRSLSAQAIHHGAATVTSPENGIGPEGKNGGDFVGPDGSKYQGVPADKVHLLPKGSKFVPTSSSTNPSTSGAALSGASPSQTVIAGPNGGVTNVDNTDVQDFMKKHPTYKVLGVGTSGSSETPYIK